MLLSKLYQIETKLNLKLWITPGILNSIKTKKNRYGVWEFPKIQKKNSGVTGN